MRGKTEDATPTSGDSLSSSFNDDVFVSLANAVMAQCHVNRDIRCFADIDVDFFVTVYEALAGEALQDVIRSPKNLEDRAHNAQVVIDSLSMDILHTSLSHVEGSSIASGEPVAVKNLLEIFSGLLEFILSKIDDSAADDDAPPAPGAVIDDADAIPAFLARGEAPPRKEVNAGTLLPMPRAQSSWQSSEKSSSASSAAASATGSLSGEETSTAGIVKESEVVAARLGLPAADAADASCDVGREGIAKAMKAQEEMRKLLARWSEEDGGRGGGAGDGVGGGSEGGDGKADESESTLVADGEEEEEKESAEVDRTLQKESVVHRRPESIVDRIMSRSESVEVLIKESEKVEELLRMEGRRVEEGEEEEEKEKEEKRQNVGKRRREEGDKVEEKIGGDKGNEEEKENVDRATKEEEEENDHLKQLRSLLKSYENLQNIIKEALVEQEDEAETAPKLIDAALSTDGGPGAGRVVEASRSEGEKKTGDGVSRKQDSTSKLPLNLGAETKSEKTRKTKSASELAKGKSSSSSVPHRVRFRSERRVTTPRECRLQLSEIPVGEKMTPRRGESSGAVSPRRTSSASPGRGVVSSEEVRRRRSPSGAAARETGVSEGLMSPPRKQGRQRGVATASTRRFEGGGGDQECMSRQLWTEGNKERIQRLVLQNLHERRLKEKGGEIAAKTRKAREDGEKRTRKYLTEIKRMKEEEEEAERKFKNGEREMAEELNENRCCEDEERLRRLGEKGERSEEEKLRRLGEKRGEMLSDDDSVDSEAEFLDSLLLRFPHLHLPRDALHRMWRQATSRLESLRRLDAAGSSRGDAGLRQLREARRKHALVAEAARKEARVEARREAGVEETRRKRQAKSRHAEKRHLAARAKRYYDDMVVSQRAKMLRARTEEELTLKRLLADSVKAQQEQLRSFRKMAAEVRERKLKTQRDKLESMENYYRDQFSMLTEALSREQYEQTVRQKEQSLVLSKMQRHLRRKMEADIMLVQDQMRSVDSENGSHFREIEAELLSKQLQIPWK